MSKSETLDSYDAVPYESYPYPQSSPEHLRTLGILFGMNPTPLEKARVLELGCAAGGNLMPFAQAYPKSQSIGVDLSKVQIDYGNELLKHTTIKNIELKHGSITDVDESWGKFDYIITHGVLSWVPEFVQEKMLEICGKNLTDNGIAYISYNTLPGWNMVRSIRDMMLYHSSTFTEDKDKISQAKLLLQFLKDSTEGSKTPYAEFLKNEANLLANQPDHYIRHEHLEDNNKQFYFHEFMSLAHKNGLQYLGDAVLSSMYVGNLPTKAAEKLSEIKDIVRTEQYMDYVTNRRFRSTLLCKNTVPLNRSLNITDSEKFYISLKAQPEKPLSEVKLEDSLENLKFFFNNSTEVFVSSSSPSMKAILYTLCENSSTKLKFEEIISLASKKLASPQKDALKADLLNNAMRLILSGYINISSESPTYSTKLTDKPKITSLARAQAEHTNSLWVSNLRHERLGINILDKFSFRYCDGKNTVDDIKKHIVEHVIKGDLTISKGEEKVTDSDAIAKEVDNLFQDYAQKLINSCLLEK